MLMTAKMVVMSHLSDAQESIRYMCGSSAIETIDFAKFVILETKGDLNQEIDADAMYTKFSDMMRARRAKSEENEG